MHLVRPAVLLTASLLCSVNLIAQTSSQAAAKPGSPHAQPTVHDGPSDEPYAFGADVSFLAQAEQNGIVLKDKGVPTPGLEILRHHGYNWIRLRVFVDPAKASTHLPNDLQYALSL